MEFSRDVVRTVFSRGGIQFRRRMDGAVEIWRKPTDGERLPSQNGLQLRRAAIIPANEWASIVTSLAAEGETGLSYGIALALHTSGAAYDPDAHKHDAAE